MRSGAALPICFHSCSTNMECSIIANSKYVQLKSLSSDNQIVRFSWWWQWPSMAPVLGLRWCFGCASKDSESDSNSRTQLPDIYISYIRYIRSRRKTVVCLSVFAIFCHGWRRRRQKAGVMVQGRGFCTAHAGWRFCGCCVQTFGKNWNTIEGIRNVCYECCNYVHIAHNARALTVKELHMSLAIIKLAMLDCQAAVLAWALVKYKNDFWCTEFRLSLN